MQYELLKIVEDGVFSVNYIRDKVTINTKNITFVGAGAFNEIINNKKDEIEDEDLIKFGLIPELVGRMGKIIKLNNLDKDTIKKIIISNKSVYKEKLKVINNENIKIKNALEESIIEEIANIAVSKKIGARAINGIVNKMFSNILFEISNPEVRYSELEISKETVNNPKKYVLRK